VRDRAELAVRDQVAGRGDGGRVAVVEADRALHAGRSGRSGDRTGVVGGKADRLLDPDVLARLGQPDADLPVQEVGCRDADGLYTGIARQVAPVPGSCGEAVQRGGLIGPPGRLVGHRDQLGAHRKPREVVQHAGVGLGVHAAHPAEAGHRHADRRSVHARTLARPRSDQPARNTWQRRGQDRSRLK
jgi:hypothetical protein